MCQKTVVDFTLMTDAQILDVLKKAKDHPPCGSFSNTQLDRASPTFWQRITKPFRGKKVSINETKIAE